MVVAITLAVDLAVARADDPAPLSFCVASDCVDVVRGDLLSVSVYNGMNNHALLMKPTKSAQQSLCAMTERNIGAEMVMLAFGAAWGSLTLSGKLCMSDWVIEKDGRATLWPPGDVVYRVADALRPN